MKNRFSSTQKEKLLKKHFFNTYHGVFDKRKIEEIMIYQLDKARVIEYFQMIQGSINEQSKILDFGSGFGEFVIFLNEMNFNAYGVENCKESFKISKLSWHQQFEKKSKIFFIESKLPFNNNSFDVITLWNVVEHISNTDYYLREISRILKKNGKIFILAPNYFSFRKEAHYHVPWIPNLSKNLSLKYLKLLGKNPYFFENYIFPITKIGLIKKIKKHNLILEIPSLDKLNNPNKIGRYWLQQTIKFLKKLGIQKILACLIKFKFYWPFSKSIFFIIRK